MIRKIIMVSGAIALMALPTSAYAQYIHQTPQYSITTIIPLVPIETPTPESTKKDNVSNLMQLGPSWTPSPDSTPKPVFITEPIEDPCGFSIAETREEAIAAVECMRNR